MKNIRSILLFSTVVLIFLSCSDDNKTNNSLEKLDYKIIQTGRTLEGCDTTEDCTSIYFYYPQFTNESHNKNIDSINAFIMNRLLFDEVEMDSGTTLEKIADEFIEDYKMQIKDFPEYAFPWYSKTNASVAYQNEKYLTIKISSESYTGGAHPNYFTNYFVLEKLTAKELSLQDLFKPNYEKELNEAVSKEFRKVRNITSNNSLTEEGFWFEDTQNIYNENFGLTDKGILFYYNPYDVAPYSMGSTVVEIPYSEINDILKL